MQQSKEATDNYGMAIVSVKEETPQSLSPEGFLGFSVGLRSPTFKKSYVSGVG
jgi:hypothetical protein